MAVVLLLIGVASEFVGIVLIGFPDFVPGTLRLAGWLRRQGRRIENLIRRLARRKARPIVVSAGASGGIAIGGSASAVVSPGANATTEDKVDFLLRRDLDTQRELNDLAGRVNRLQTESTRQLAEARQDMEQHVDRELATALTEYRPLRVVGTIALAVGLACVTVATFLA